MLKVGDLVTIGNHRWKHIMPTQEEDQKAEEELAKNGKYTGPPLFEQKAYTSWETPTTGMVIDIVEKDEEYVVYKSAKSKITEHRSRYHVLTSDGKIEKTWHHLLQKLE